MILGLGYGFSVDSLILSYFLWIFGRSCLIFVVFWVSVVLTGFGGGSGWMVMVGRCWVNCGICILVVAVLQVLCVCVGVFVCIKGRRR